MYGGKAEWNMQEPFGRLENLVQGTIQIIDHMTTDSSDDETLRQMKQILQQEYDKIAGLKGQVSDVDKSRQTFASMQQSISQVQQLIDPVESDSLEKYKQETGGAMQQFESQPLDEQKRETEAYHGKIDYRSAVKIQENLNKIKSELLDLSGNMERSVQNQWAPVDPSGGASAYQSDRDPSPPSLSP